MNKRSQEAIRCFLCKKTTQDPLLCKNCISNPFIVENARSKAAKNGKLEIFKRLYSKTYGSIKNVNSKHFWNKYFEKNSTLSNQDSMTRDKIRNIVLQIPNKHSDILDLGFGQGYFEEALEEKNKSYSLFGIDISDKAVNRAKGKFKGDFRSGDVLKIREIFGTKKFDVVIAIELIEHITPQKTLKLFSDIRLLLKPQGIFIISTPTNEGLRKLKSNPSGHVREYTIPIVKTEFEISGFKIEKLRTFYAFKNHYILKKFLAGVFRNRWKPNNIVIRAVKK